MLNQFSRTELLIGKEGMEKLASSRVAVFGVGGVGGYTVEALARSGLGNITVIDGNAEDVLSDMPKPDSVFIGGSGGKLSDIVEILHGKGEGIRYVINAVSLETVEEVRKLIKKYEPEDEETVMISVSNIKKVGAYHMLQGQNPVYIFSFTL